jgi:NADH-quinone oxidoreductase subunit F
MDLRFPDAAASDAELDALDRVLGPLAPSGHGDADEWNREIGGLHRSKENRHLLLGALWALQDRVGWISEGGLGELCRRLDIPPAEAYGVASFYAMFSLTEAPPRTVHVCIDIACELTDATALLDRLQAAVEGRTDVRAIPSPCLGLCERAPAALVSEAGVEPHEIVVAPATDVLLLGAAEHGPHHTEGELDPVDAIPQFGDPALVLLSRIGHVVPTSLDSYRRHGGYLALARAVEIGRQGVLDDMAASGLMGRGGAAFPAGRKWAAVASQPAQPHYLVCNADESEPGTFKDRILMEGDPFALVEAMTIAGYATGCERGYIYLRGEYPPPRAHLTAAIEAARSARLLGADVGGHGFAFDIEIVRGAGAYICGEETAIFNSIEGFRGEPRSKPPFPVEVGLFGKPTVVNNVETLVNVLPIVLHGGAAYASIGTPQSTGTKLFCVSGAVAKPGVYEVPFGATTRDLLTLAGGMRNGSDLQAVLLGGAAGSFISAQMIDGPLTFEAARSGGYTLGSGVIMVFDTATDLRPLLGNIAHFFRDESCGQCVPCRVGTVRQQEALVRLAAATSSADADREVALLREIGQAMRDASICGLGQTAWNAIESAIDRLDVAGVKR